MHVRDAEPEDAPAVDAVHAAAVRDLTDHYTAAQRESWVAGPDDSDGEGEVENGEGGDDEDESRAEGDGEEKFVADADGEVIGFSAFDPDGPEVSAVYVHPDRQGEGVGRALLERAEAAARARGVEELRVHASVNARAFYERAGYRVVEETALELSDGTELECAVMRKRVGRER